MNGLLRLLATVAMAFGLAGCADSSPGSILGDWEATDTGVVRSFRVGETESLGIVDKVSYESSGGVTVMTFEAGPGKGTSMTFKYITASTIKSGSRTFKRLRS